MSESTFKDNKFSGQWGGQKVNFIVSDDYETIHINNPDDRETVSVPTASLIDLLALMKKHRRDGSDKESIRIWNMTGTSNAAPQADWS